MSAYLSPSEDLLQLIKPYIKKGENILVSGQLRYDNNLYREILFNKKSFVNSNKETVGILYIQENNKIIRDKKLQKVIGKLAYYYEIFFDYEGKNSIFSSIRNKENLDKEKNNLFIAMKGLEFLEEQDMKIRKHVKNILLKLPDLNEKNNNKLNELYLLIKRMKEEREVFDEENIKKIYPLYKQILILNFENIKLISSGQKYYDDLYISVRKRTSSFFIRLNKKKWLPLSNLEYQLIYFRELIKTCKQVDNMDLTEYMKFLSDIENKNIKARVNISRV